MKTHENKTCLLSTYHPIIAIVLNNYCPRHITSSINLKEDPQLPTNLQ